MTPRQEYWSLFIPLATNSSERMCGRISFCDIVLVDYMCDGIYHIIHIIVFLSHASPQEHVLVELKITRNLRKAQCLNLNHNLNRECEATSCCVACSYHLVRLMLTLSLGKDKGSGPNWNQLNANGKQLYLDTFNTINNNGLMQQE